jgi:hypothetical protein
VRRERDGCGSLRLARHSAAPQRCGLEMQVAECKSGALSECANHCQLCQLCVPNFWNSLNKAPSSPEHRNSGSVTGSRKSPQFTPARYKSANTFQHSSYVRCSAQPRQGLHKSGKKNVGHVPALRARALKLRPHWLRTLHTSVCSLVSVRPRALHSDPPLFTLNLPSCPPRPP